MKKRIALVGNMNNNFFPLMRYLEDLYQVDLILLESEQSHFFPENDTFESKRYSIISSKLSVLPSAFFHIEKKYIRELLQPYDIIIGCGPAPAYISKINIKLDIFVPYGSDIYYIPFIPFKWGKGMFKLIKEQYFKFHQKRGILKASKILMDFTNKSYEDLFQGLNIKGKRIFANVPFLYVPEFNESNIKNHYGKSQYYPKFSSIRDDYDMVIFHHSRHEWNLENTIEVKLDNHTKGNDKLIKAFASFLKKSMIKAHLILFEYGSSVELSKSLISNLGIQKNVTWMPLMPRKEIMIGISLCDIGVGELDSSYYSYGTIYEFLAMAKPVIHYRDDELYRNYYEEMYPMFSANTSTQIENYFNDYVKNPEYFINTGEQANKWFLKYAIEAPLKFIKNLINEKNN